MSCRVRSSSTDRLAASSTALFALATFAAAISAELCRRTNGERLREEDDDLDDDDDEDDASPAPPAAAASPFLDDRPKPLRACE